MTNRRSFLSQTALGAGSVLFLPELLVSCTDHRNLPPTGDTPIVGMPVGEEFYDTNNSLKTILAGTLGTIPIVGQLISCMIRIFWPDTKVDVWAEVRNQVNDLVNQKISDQVYLRVKEDLEGLYCVMMQYLNETHEGNQDAAYRKWDQLRGLFAENRPHFQSEGHEVVLQILFTQFANMHLAILRDGVIKGKDWGRNELEHKQDIQDLQNAITSYVVYSHKTLADGWIQVYNQAISSGKDACQIEAACTIYAQKMTLLTYDHAAAWPYFDVSLYSNGPRVPIRREIYSGLQGYCKGYDLLKKYGFDSYGSSFDHNIPPKNAPTQITVWFSDVIEGMQVTYPTGGGLGGITQTVRMGLDSLNGGSTQPPRSRVFNLSPTNPIVLVRLSFNKYPPQYDNDILGVSAIQFVYKDGETTPWVGTRGSSDIVEVNPPAHHYISSIYFGAYMVAFGFQYINLEAPVTPDALRTLFITSPIERTVAELAQAFPELGISQTLINDDLKKARQEHWASIKARAEDPGSC